MCRRWWWSIFRFGMEQALQVSNRSSLADNMPCERNIKSARRNIRQPLNVLGNVCPHEIAYFNFKVSISGGRNGAMFPGDSRILAPFRLRTLNSNVERSRRQLGTLKSWGAVENIWSQFSKLMGKQDYVRILNVKKFMCASMYSRESIQSATQWSQSSKIEGVKSYDPADQTKRLRTCKKPFTTSKPP